MACTKPKEIKDVNFYYWKTQYDLNETETNALDDQKSKKVYVRLCDVKRGHDKKIHPRDVIQFKSRVNKRLEYIPVFFILPKVFDRLDADNPKDQEELKDLAINIQKLAKSTWQHKGLELKEIQIDCDWTKSHKNAFYYFMKVLNDHCNETISATVRLHQIKYAEKIGVPAMDKAVLMCYNMGNLRDFDAANSIFDLEVIQSYMSEADEYEDIPISIALPIFNWALVYDEDMIFKGISGMRKIPSSYYFEKISENKYQCTTRYYSESTIDVGDYVRFEHVSKKDLNDALVILKEELPSWNEEVILYDLNEKSLNRYANPIITIKP